MSDDDKKKQGNKPPPLLFFSENDLAHVLIHGPAVAQRQGPVFRTAEEWAVVLARMGHGEKVVH